MLHSMPANVYHLLLISTVHSSYSLGQEFHSNLRKEYSMLLTIVSLKTANCTTLYVHINIEATTSNNNDMARDGDQN